MDRRGWRCLLGSLLVYTAVLGALITQLQVSSYNSGHWGEDPAPRMIVFGLAFLVGLGVWTWGRVTPGNE